jgi:hypothetical protein
MPIPTLNTNGLLPEGVHICTLDEVRLRFGRFAANDRRVKLFERLAELINELRSSGMFVAVVVDGSFVTAKPAPEDIDLIVLLRRGHDWKADLSARDYKLVSRRALRRRFEFDVLLASDDDATCDGYVEFFSRVRDDTSVRKGMLRMNL